MDTSPETVTFDSHGVALEGWWLPARADDLSRDGRAPCVVMAHGFGCTRDCGLLPFAERFAAADCHVLVFDYRGFGTSGGSLRQDIDHRRHREDYHAAVGYVRRRDDVDPRRVVAWGTSYSGGHVVAVAAQDQGLAAIISQGAAMDGLAALTGRGKDRSEAPTPKATPPGGRRSGAGKNLSLLAGAVRDAAGGALGRDAVEVPFFGPVGSGALISGDGAVEFTGITGPTFRNAMCARGLLRIGFNRPVRVADRVTCPALLVVAERDEIAPASAVHRTAERIGDAARILSFDCRHFSLYTGAIFEESVAAQVAFLGTVLSV